jgi:hypothetical protein
MHAPSIPPQAVASLPLVIYFLWKVVGVSAAAGCGVMVVGNFVMQRLIKILVPHVKKLQEVRG